MNIKEFADIVGVSTATVSRAIHGRGRISPATRQMVLARMREVGFTPNLHAQRLVTGRSHVIALDFLGEAPVLSDMFFVELARGLQEALSGHGYTLLLSLMAARSPREMLAVRWAEAGAIDGMIVVAGAGVGSSLACELASHAEACVLIAQDTVSGVTGVGSVGVGLAAGAGEVACYLTSLGHRRVGFIASDAPDVVAWAFRAEMQRLGAPLRDSDIVQAGRTADDGRRAMEELLDRPDPPTAVFARTDTLAVGALNAALARGLSVPRHVSIVGHDGVPAFAWTTPPLTTVRVDCTALGRAASGSLLALFERPGGSSAPVVVPTRLVERATVGPPLARRRPG